MPQSKDDVASVSSAMRSAMESISDRALDKLPALLTGERGVGKRRLARWLHQHSPEARTALVVCQLSDEPEDVCCEVLSSKIHQAEGGALFVDEIADLPLGAQGKIVEALQSHKLRLIASSSSNDEQGRLSPALRAALGAPIQIPTLRERREDLPLLVSSFLVEAGLPHDAIAPTALEALLQYSWPENVRELKHTIIRALHTNGGVKIKLEHLPSKLHG